MCALLVSKSPPIYDAHPLLSNAGQNQQNPPSLCHFRRLFRQILWNFSRGSAYNGVMHAQQMEAMTTMRTFLEAGSCLWQIW